MDLSYNITTLKNVYNFDLPIPVMASNAESHPSESSHIILFTGEFNHGGDILTITDNDLESMVTNFHARVIGTDPPVDFSHEDGKMAAGWIKELQLTEIELDGETRMALFATICWSKSGREALTNKEFRYFSASFSTIITDGSTGKSFGPTLRGGALTNIPFLKRLDPIVELSSSNIKKFKTKIKTKENKRMDTIELSEHKAQMKVFTDRVKDLEIANNELAIEVKGFADIKGKNDTLKEELFSLKKEIDKNEKTQKFEKLLSEGNACEAQRECFMSDDMEGFINNAKKVNLSNRGSSSGVDADVTMSASDRKMFNHFLSDHMTEEEFIKFQEKAN